MEKQWEHCFHKKIKIWKCKWWYQGQKILFLLIFIDAVKLQKEPEKKHRVRVPLHWAFRWAPETINCVSNGFHNWLSLGSIVQNSQIQRIIFVFFCVLTPLHYKILFKFQEFLNAGFIWTGGPVSLGCWDRCYLWMVEFCMVYSWLCFFSIFLQIFSRMSSRSVFS